MFFIWFCYYGNRIKVVEVLGNIRDFYYVCSLLLIESFLWYGNCILYFFFGDGIVFYLLFLLFFKLRYLIFWLLIVGCKFWSFRIFLFCDFNILSFMYIVCFKVGG